jgi:hypothetical protein
MRSAVVASGFRALFCRSRLPCITLLVTAGLIPCPAWSQSPRPAAIQQGASIQLEIAQTSSWDVELGPPDSRTATTGKATGLAVTAAYGVNSWLAPWASFTWSAYGDGDLSAVSELAGGAEVRSRQFGRFAPSVALGVGRTVSPAAGGFRFNHADVAANGDYFLSDRLALRAGVHGLFPLGEATGTDGDDGQSFRVADSRIQLRLGLRYQVGHGRD